MTPSFFPNLSKMSPTCQRTIQPVNIWWVIFVINPYVHLSSNNHTTDVGDGFHCWWQRHTCCSIYPNRQWWSLGPFAFFNVENFSCVSYSFICISSNDDDNICCAVIWLNNATAMTIPCWYQWWSFFPVVWPDIVDKTLLRFALK